MKTQNYLCVDVKTYTHENIQENQALFGMMEMTEQDERFEFQQVHMPLAPYRFRPDIRNPKIYAGTHFSLTRQKDGISTSPPDWWREFRGRNDRSSALCTTG